MNLLADLQAAAPEVVLASAALVGVLWLIGRVIYATSYMADPAKRGTGMIITLLATTILAVISLYGIVLAIL